MWAVCVDVCDMCGMCGTLYTWCGWVWNTRVHKLQRTQSQYNHISKLSLKTFTHTYKQNRHKRKSSCAPTSLVAIVVLHHVLDDNVAVEFVGIIILIPATPVLVGPLDHQVGVHVPSTLEIFLTG